MNRENLQKLQDLFVRDGIAGTDCAVYQEGEEIYRYWNGWANLEEKRSIARDTIYAMCSMTKFVTCTALLQLYEKGLFLLDDRLCDYMPEFSDRRVKRGRVNGKTGIEYAKNDITIGDLFSMTGGVSNLYDDPSYLEFAAANPDFTTEELTDFLAGKPLEYEPGTHWFYGHGHDILARLAEVLTGKRFEEYCRENIFEPLHMEDAHFHVPKEKQARCASWYVYNRGSGVPGQEVRQFIFQPSSNYDSGGAGLFCTVDDYGKFAVAMANKGQAPSGERILRRETVELMQKNWLTAQMLQDLCETPRNQYIGYGYGLGVRTLLDGGLAGALYSSDFGWYGAAGTYVSVNPDLQVAVVYAMQMMPAPELAGDTISSVMCSFGRRAVNAAYGLI